MKQNILRVMSIILAFALTFSIHSNGQAAPERAAIMPDKVVNLAFFYKPPNNSDASTVAKNFNTVVLTHLDESFRDQLKTNGFSSTIPQYLRFEAIMDPGDCTSTPMRNQVAYKPGDFCTISRDHPDWFLLDAQGKRLGADKLGDNYYMMDPGNQAWRAFWLSRALEMQAQFGWSGLFLDNVEASLTKRKMTSGLPAKYADDIAYKSAVRGFLDYLYNNYAKANNRPMIANIATLKERVSWYEYLPYLDGAMTERWSVDWSYSSYADATTWEADMLMAEQTQSLGKSIIMVAPGSETDINRQNFAFASYLLVSNGKAAFRYSNSSTYRYIWLYSNYQVDLGTPLGPRYKSGTLWRRDFTKGFVTVDPANHTATISTAAPTTLFTNTPAVSPTPLAPTATLIQPTATAITLSTQTAKPPTVTSVPPSATPISPTATIVVASPTLNQPTSTSQTTGSTTAGAAYDDKDKAIISSGTWLNEYRTKAYQQSIKVTEIKGSSIALKFTGSTFTILYTNGPSFSTIDVYVDNVLVGTINEYTKTIRYQKQWTCPKALAYGAHEIKLVFTGPAPTRGNVDAILVK